MGRRLVTVTAALLWACTVDPGPHDDPQVAVEQFHGVGKLGWNDASEIRRDDARRGLEIAWTSGALDAATIGGVEVPTRIYASPLWVDDTVIVATSSGLVHAFDAASGAPRWATAVVEPEWTVRLDGGVALGVLSTPVARDGVLYGAGLDDRRGWVAFALSVDDGALLRGWPVALDADTLTRINRGAAASVLEPVQMSQRGALALSPEGDRLYVSFGTFWGEGPGWIAAVDTQSAAVTDAFAAAPDDPQGLGSAGIWGAAGPLVLEGGDVLVTTGNSPPGSETQAGVWGNSLLRFDRELRLTHHYTPFDYCLLDEHNMDLAATQPLRLPGTSLVAFGGKQGVVYLVDTDALRPAGDGRPPCRSEADADDSLLPPAVAPQYGTRGPLSVFGPYSRVYGQIDHAKMRTKLAYFEGSTGPVLFAAGSSKADVASTTSVPPSVVRLELAEPGPHLQVAARNEAVAMLNPGSPVVSSLGADDAIVWVLDRNALRTAPALDPQTPEPVLYAFDGATLELLWRSEPGTLGPSGKYTTPVVVGDTVFVVTDRITALRPTRQL